jgi:hypothetical protein
MWYIIYRKTTRNTPLRRSLKEMKEQQGVAEPSPIGVQMITRYKGDQALP